jgi:hypothetical protein
MGNENETPTVDLSAVQNWNAERANETNVKDILSNNGNKFSFQFVDKHVSAVHIYVGYNKNSGKINFQVIKSDEDTKENENAVAVVSVDAAKSHLPPLNINAGNDPHFIDYETANARINDYINPAMRDAWVHDTLSNGNEIWQAFVVDKIDFEPNSSYDCYLALETKDEKHYIDLIVYNTNGTVENGLRDMSTPCPPYGSSGKTAIDNFGLLQNL